MMLLAVAVASPGTMRLEPTKKYAKGATNSIIRYKNPAALAVFLVGGISSPLENSVG
jgi:hypothetical protein